MAILKSNEVAEGKYTCLSYEFTSSMKNQYKGYIIKAIRHEDQSEVKFHANTYMAQFLNMKSPTKKFEFTVNDDDNRKIFEITGYTTEIVLN